MSAFLRTLLVSLLLAFVPSTQAARLVQEFFVPLPEDLVQKSFKSLYAGVGSEMNSVISIVVTANSTVIHYDHWEDGYEVDLENPVQASTEIWGDCNDANGRPPGYASDPCGLTKGSVITLRNAVALPRNPADRKYDGRDRFGASIAVVATRAEWATTPGTVLAGAAEMLSLRDYGNDFRMPVGQNLATIDNAMFEYTGLVMVAAKDGTNCTYNGAATIPTLNRGSNHHINGGVNAGDRLSCDKPVQVHLVTGDVNANYESRWFLVYPTSRWSSAYFSPVGTSANGNATFVFLYNPDTNPITVNYETLSGNGSVTVAANGGARVQMPVSSGGHFYTGGAPFYAVATVGANPSANNVNDWGFLLVPKGALTTEAVAGWAPGNGNQPPTNNGSPLWVTVEKDTTVYVDYGGNGGPSTAPNGQAYDTAIAVKRLQSVIVASPGFDNTGTRLFTTDGTLLTAAWGQNPAVAGPALPYLDMGTAVLPFPVPAIRKSAALLTDVNGNGLPNVGDTLRYTLTINNTGLIALDSTMVVDDIGAGAGGGLTYVPGSTRLNGAVVPDGAGSAFPLLGPTGYSIPDIPPGESSALTYDATITRTGSITNVAFLANPNVRGSSTVIVPQATPATCTLAFTNAGGVGTSTYGVGETIYLRLVNTDLNLDSSRAEQQTIVLRNPANGAKDIETVTLTETGIATGVFTGSLPASSSAGQTNNDGTLFVQLGDAIQASSTYPTCAPATASVPVPTRTKTLYLTGGGTSLTRTVPTGGTASHSASLSTSTGAATITVVGAAASSLTADTPTSHSFNYDSGSTGSNRLLMVGISYRNRGSETVTSVTYNGVALTQVGTDQVNTGGGNWDGRVYIYRLVNPPTGSNALAVTWSAALQRGAVIGAVTYSGVDAASPTGAFASATSAGSTTPAVTVASAAGELAFGVVSGRTTSNYTTTAPGTSHWSTRMTTATSDGSTAGAAQSSAGAASVTLGWTGTNNAWVAGGVSLRPAAGGGGGTTSATFTQAPAMSSALFLPAGSTVSARACLTVTAGTMPANPSVSLALRRAGTTFATLSSPTYSATTAGCGAGSGPGLAWSGSLGADVTVATGETISAVYDVTGLASTIAFTIDYGSSTAVSRIDLPTTTVIAVDSLAVYDAPWPGGSVVTTANNGQTLYVRLAASDPFGAYDITGATLAIAGPGGSCSLAPAIGAGNVVSTTAGAKVYEYAWSTGTCQGAYVVNARVDEGTEGTVWATGSAQVTLSELDLGTPATLQFVDAGGADKATYTTAQQVCVKVTDLDQAGKTDAIQVLVTGSLTGAQARVTLAETPAGSGTFRYCFGAPGSSAPFVNGDVLNGSYTDPNDATDTAGDTALVTDGAPPSLLLAKSRTAPADGIAVVGETVTYEITATNPGAGALATVTLADTFDAACYDFVSATPAASSTGAGTIGWSNVGPLAAGATARITATFRARAACTTAQATNSATASGSASAGPATATVRITNPAVTVAKSRTSATTATIGDTATFSVVVTNAGNTNLVTVPVADSYSTCLAFASAVPAASSAGGGTALWNNVGPLAPGASATITATFTVVGACAPALNTAEVGFAVDENGDTAAPGSGSASLTSVAASISGRVYHDTNASAVVDAGENGIPGVVVRLYLDPNGDGDLTDATLVAVQATDSAGGYQFVGLAPNTGAARYIVEEVDPPRFRSVSPANNRIVVNVATTTDHGGRDFLDTLLGAASLSVTKTHTGNFVAGSTGNAYTVTVSNTGGSPTSGAVTVTESAPAGMTVTAMAGTGWTCTPPACTRADALTAGASWPPLTVTVTIAAGAASPLVNAVSVSGGGAPTTGTTDSTTIVAPALTLAKTHAGNFTQGQAGATYTITVGNSGTAPTSGTVTVTDTLPASLAYVSGTGTGWSCGAAGQVVTCTSAAVIAAGATGNPITLAVNVSASAPASVTNTATASGGGATNTPSANDPTTIGTLPTLTIAKVHAGTFSAGQAGATYTITVGNSGTAPTSGTITVADTLPASLAYVSGTGTGWSCGAAGQVVTCTSAAAIAAGASGSPITLTVNVSATAPSSITNTASASGGGAPNTPSSSDTATLGALPEMRVSLTGLPASTAPNVVVRGTVTCTNVGAAAATNATCAITAGGTLANCRVGGTGVTPPVASLAAGASIACDVTATAPASGTHAVNAATGAANDTGSVGKTASHTITVTSAPGTGSITGHVWYDLNRNRALEATEPRRSGWRVELLSGSTVLATATSGGDGGYAFGTLQPGVYTVRFVDPAGAVLARGPLPVNGDSGGNGGTASLSQLAGITLGVGTAVVNQSLPLDPSGVVYDSVTRAPIAGATVELLYGGAAINPAWVAGGSATQSSAAGGHYAFFLLPAALPGTYSLRVSMPPGYRPTPSATIAPSIAPAGFAGGSVGTAGAPPVGAVTTYYLSFPLPTSDITNNNIPLDAAAVAAAPIPTLSEWGMIVLAMMLAASAWQSRRRPRRAR